MSESAAEDDEIIAALRGAPTWITPTLVQDTWQTFRPYYGPDMTAEDAVEILLNVGNLFELLIEKPRSTRT